MRPAPPAVPLSELLGNPRPALVRHGPDPLIRGLAYDSRKVRPGDLFVCLRGTKDDGHRHAADATRRGAAAVLAERSVEGLDGLPLITVADSRHELARLAARFYGGPSASLHLTGVTGTEGKTTTVYLLDAILRGAGRSTGMFDLLTIKGALEELPGVPGRFEVVPNSRDLLVVVDFAHTLAAFEEVLPFLRRFTPGRIITIFGCAGDRDRTKRAAIGRFVVSRSDFAIVTTDNPASEDPADIAQEVVRGIRELDPHGQHHDVRLDRGDAVRHALLLARSGDTVLLAGKGHEDFQLVGGTRIPYSDRETVEQILRVRNAGRGLGCPAIPPEAF